MISKKSYKNLLEIIMEVEQENKKLQEYMEMIVPEKSLDKEYIEKLTNKVCEIHSAVDLELDKYWIADNYINMLREVEAF